MEESALFYVLLMFMDVLSLKFGMEIQKNPSEHLAVYIFINLLQFLQLLQSLK